MCISLLLATDHRVRSSRYLNLVKHSVCISLLLAPDSCKGRALYPLSSSTAYVPLYCLLLIISNAVHCDRTSDLIITGMCSPGMSLRIPHPAPQASDTTVNKPSDALSNRHVPLRYEIYIQLLKLRMPLYRNLVKKIYLVMKELRGSAGRVPVADFQAAANAGEFLPTARSAVAPKIDQGQSGKCWGVSTNCFVEIAVASTGKVPRMHWRLAVCASTVSCCLCFNC